VIVRRIVVWSKLLNVEELKRLRSPQDRLPFSASLMMKI
jgi:hypothetical protein